MRHSKYLALILGLLTVPSPTTAQSRRGLDSRTARFWTVIDGARAGGGDCELIARRLEERLTVLPDSTLEEFARTWSEWWGASYTWDLWGVAHLINGGSSDDGFDYFRGWLLAQGSSRWEKVVQGADSAFDDVAPGTVAECEDIVVTLPNVYEDRFHRLAPDPGQLEPSGRKWTEASLKTRFPRLARRFGAGG